MKSNRNKQLLLFFLRDKNKKNWLQIINEFLVLFISNRGLPLNYISHLLYRKNVTNYRDYLSLKENSRLLQWSSSKGKEQIELVKNKLFFQEHLKKNNIPTPKIIFHNSNDKFVYEGTIYRVETRNDFFLFLAKVFNDKQIEQLFCKPIDAGQGLNIFILEKNTYHRTADDIIDMMFSGSFIFQEVIKQHEDLKKINSSCINTLRIVTYKNEENEVEILCGAIRVGRKGAIKDNAHAGGIVVAFNKQTGTMHAEGLQLPDFGGGIFHKHPDSGILFDKYQIPDYDEVKEIIVKAASSLQFPLLGWDVALTPGGPVIIEANHSFHLLFSDRIERGLKRNPTVKNLLEQIP